MPHESITIVQMNRRLAFLNCHQLQQRENCSQTCELPRAIRFRVMLTLRRLLIRGKNQSATYIKREKGNTWPRHFITSFGIIVYVSFVNPMTITRKESHYHNSKRNLFRILYVYNNMRQRIGKFLPVGENRFTHKSRFL